MKKKFLTDSAMARFCLSVMIFIMVPVFASSQAGDDLYISGIVTGGSEDMGLGFVNIGIYKKNLGTISDMNGYFGLVVPDSLRNDTLTFSCVGYETLRLPVKSLTHDFQTRVRMKTRMMAINEVTIQSKQPEIRNYGTRSHSPFVFAPAYVDLDVYELAILVRPGELPVKAKKLKFFIYSAGVDSCRFRINFYDVAGDLPGNRINTMQIMIRKTLLQKAWNEIDLGGYDLAFDEDFFVSVEFIPDFESERSYEITYGVKMIKGGKTYIRSSSQGEWTTHPFNFSMNIDLMY